MRYTHLFKGLIILFAVFTFTRCNDQLDEDPELTSYLDDIDYSSQEGATGALVGAYAAFQSVGWEQIPLIAVRGDDVNAGGLGDQQGFSDIDNYNYDNNYWMPNSLWKEWFQDILQVTSQIEQLELYKAGGVDADLVDQYIAEAKTIRAFMTLELSRVFGDVYKITSSDETQLSVQTKDDLMQWISDEMDEAIPELLDMRPNQRADLPGGITKYTALAVKAMAEQELKDYQGVADATGEIISSGKFTLYSDFYELFKIPGKLCDENLWEIQYSDFGQASGDNVAHLFAFYGPQNWTPAVSDATAGWGFFEPSLKYIKFMLDRGEEVRLETSVLFTDRGITEIQSDSDYATLPSWISNTTRDGDIINDFSREMFVSGKHYLPSNQLTPGRTAYGTNKNYTVMRYAEILLMYAEALTRGATGTAGSADTAVNLVRQRAGLDNISGVTSQQVMDEKFAELSMEWGIRYFDMVRLEETDELSYNGRTFSMDKAFLPYPLAQIDASPILSDYINNN